LDLSERIWISYEGGAKHTDRLSARPPNPENNNYLLFWI
jgi:hypothetical protein